MGDNWDPQKMLDLYIHDYMVKKNMHTTAEIFAREADIRSKSVLINPPDGFLTEWWSLLWDMYNSRLTKNISHPTQASSSKDPQNAGGSGPQNTHLANVLMTDGNYMLQNIRPTMPPPGLPNLQTNVGPTIMPRPDMVDFLGTVLAKSPLGRPPIPGNNMGQQQSIANMMAAAARMRELQPPRPPGNSHLLDVELLTSMLPTSSRLSNPQKKVTKKRPVIVTKGDNIGTGSRGITIQEPTPPAPKSAQHNMDPPADTGRNEVNKIPSEGCSVGQAVVSPVSNQKTQGSAPSTLDLAAQTSGKLIITAPESSTKMAAPIHVDDASLEKDLQTGENKETKKPVDDDIESFFTKDGSPDEIIASFAHTLAQTSSAQNNIEQQGFPFQQFKSLHPTKNKLSCCDFSTEGKFIAAAGHEKQVFIWNLKQSTRQTIFGHSQLITDVRFQPISNILATSSFDRSVHLLDATKPGRPFFNLVGHREHVMSVDFHPRKANLLCSCDSNDEIRLWNTQTSACFHSFKGANRQVRFQPRQGNLLAAASGNIISLIDVETSMIQYRFEGHAKDVRSICWDVCGQYLVSISEDSARIWSLTAGGNCVHVLHSRGNRFASCTFHPAYSQVVAVGSYQSIDIWNPTMGKRTWNYRAHEGIVSALANSSETNVIASVSHDQWIKLWK